MVFPDRPIARSLRPPLLYSGQGHVLFVFRVNVPESEGDFGHLFPKVDESLSSSICPGSDTPTDHSVTETLTLPLLLRENLVDAVLEALALLDAHLVKALVHGKDGVEATYIRPGPPSLKRED